MKKMFAILLIAAAMILYGCQLLPHSTLSGNLMYVSDYHDYWDYSTATYQIVEQNVGDNRKKIIYEANDKLYLLYDRTKELYGAFCDDEGMVRVWNLLSNDLVWEDYISAPLDERSDALLMIDDGCLYYCTQSYNEEMHYVDVFKKRMGGQAELLIQIADNEWHEKMHFSLSSSGDMAYVQRSESDFWNPDTGYYATDYVYLYRGGQNLLIGEGSFPVWFSSEELWFVQGEWLMSYDVNTGKTAAVYDENGEGIEIRQKKLYASPTITQDNCYLVYATNRDMSESLPQNQGISVVSLKNGKKYIFKELDSVFESMMVTAILE